MRKIGEWLRKLFLGEGPNEGPDNDLDEEEEDSSSYESPNYPWNHYQDDPNYD